MKKKYIIILVSVAVVLLFVLFAADTTFAEAGKIDNPLKATSIQGLIAFGLTFVVNLLAIAGVVWIIWTGFLFVKAQGNEKELEVAKKSFFNAIVGMAIILGAWGIAQAIAKTLSGITKTSIPLEVPKN
jgi:ribose/xylose/arabinose/galactoside ABC-type transport system permease subunit